MLTICNPIAIRNLSAERVLDALALVQETRRGDLDPETRRESAKVLRDISAESTFVQAALTGDLDPETRRESAKLVQILAAEAALRGLFGELRARLRRKVGAVQAAALT